MSHTALYRAFIAAGTEGKLAKEAAESVMYAREAATRTDLAEFKAEIGGNIAALDAKVDLFRAELKGDIAAAETRLERSLHAITWRFIGYVFAMQTLFLAFDRLVLGG